MDTNEWYPEKCLRPGEGGYTLEQGKFCVGRGWHPLVERAFAVIHDTRGYVVQVKEKWGGLCVYPSWDGVPDTGKNHRATFDALDAIEEESRRTCERCGAPGWLVGDGWVKTLCPPHALKYLAGERFPSWEQADDANLS